MTNNNQQQYNYVPLQPPQQTQTYAQPQQQIVPVYKEQASFNPNIVAITIGGIAIFSIYSYFSGGLLSTIFGSNPFSKSPDKDWDTNYAQFARQLYDALGYAQNDNEDAVYATAQEIYVAMQSDSKVWKNTESWFSRKYGKSVKSHLETFLSPDEMKRFLEIIAKGNYNPAVQNAVAQQTGVFAPKAQTKEVTSTWKKGDVIFVKTFSDTQAKVRTSPILNNSKIGGNNVAFSMTGKKHHPYGYATGKVIETKQGDQTYRWVEFMIKFQGDYLDNFEKFVIKKYDNGNNYIDFLKKNKSKWTEGIKLYIAESNLMKVSQKDVYDNKIENMSESSTKVFSYMTQSGINGIGATPQRLPQNNTALLLD